MAEPGTFRGELERGWRRFWALKWRWKGPILVVGGLLALGLISAPFSEEGSAPPSSPDGGDSVAVPTAVATETPALPTVAVAASPTAGVDRTQTATPAPSPTLSPIDQERSTNDAIEKSIRDNKDAVKSGASLDGLMVRFDAASGVLTASIMPKKPDSPAGFLTNGSALAVIVGKAVWSTYPGVEQLNLYVRRTSTDTVGLSHEEFATFARYSRVNAESMNYTALRTQPSDDNKRMYCDADLYDVALDIFESLKDRGCLTRFAGVKGAISFYAGPVYAQLPKVGEHITLKNDGWILTVNRSHKVGRVVDSFEEKTALGVYVVIELTMENVSNTTHALCGDRFTIVDDRGRSYGYFLAGTVMYGAEELCSQINAGLRAPAVVLFDMPPDATGLVLKSLGGFRVALGNVADIP